MTRLSAPVVIECPECGAYLLHRSLASFHDFVGTTYWSDGYAHLFMVREAARLGACPECSEPFWVEDADTLGILPREPISLRWGWLKRLTLGRQGEVRAAEAAWQAIPEPQRRALSIKEITPLGLMGALGKGLATTPEREIYLRTQLWPSGNHAHRDNGATSPMSPDETNVNMLALLALVQGGPDLASAEQEGELLRELGRFDEAMAVLGPVASSSDSAALILGLAREGNAAVCVVHKTEGSLGRCAIEGNS